MIAAPGNERTRLGLFLTLIAIGALLLRLWHLEFGLPSRYHPDEVAKVKVALQIVEGQPVTYFLHPGFLINSVAASFKVSEWLGLDKTTYRLRWARLSVAVLAMFTIPVMGLLCWRLGGERAAYAGALAIACVPIHVLHSRYTKEDIHLTFSVLLTLLGLCWWRTGDRRLRSWSFATVALGAGLAVSSKFVGAAMVLFAIIVVAMSLPRASARITAAALILIGSVAVFLAFAHHVLATPEVMWRGFDYELHHGTAAPWKPTLKLWQWPDLGFYFLVTTIAPGLGIPLTLAGLWGAWLAWRDRRSTPDHLVVAACCLLFYFIAELTPLKRGTGVERYALPAAALLIPLALLALRELAARGIAGSAGRYAALIVLLLALPLAQSVLVSERIDRDTRREAQKWLNTHAPRGNFRMGYLSQLYMPDWARRGELVLCDIMLPEEEFEKSIEGCSAFAMSSFFNDRYENFPRLSPSEVARIDLVRRQFPYAIVFRRPFYRTMYFHQPVIEIRFREPLQGTEKG